MKRSTIIVTAIVALGFVLSWILKAMETGAGTLPPFLQGFLITSAAFLTLAVFSFLYQDNPFYKFAEHLYVGVSAAFWMCQGFWSTVVGNLIPRISEGLSNFFKVPYRNESWDFMFWLPVVLGVILLMRLSSKIGWISRWSMAFIIGTTAGLNFVRYMRSDFVEQISSTMLPLLVDWKGFGDFWAHANLSFVGQFAAIVTNVLIFFGVICGIVYFFFSKEHTGWFGRASRVGIWVLMITFGASFGYTVMGRISLLVGRLTFLYHDWLGLIK